MTAHRDGGVPARPRRRTPTALLAAVVAVVAGPVPVGAQEPETASLTVSVRVPADTGPVYLTGNLPQLGPWDPAALALEGDGALRSVVLEVPLGHTFEYKFTLGSWPREAVDPSGTVMPNFRHVLRRAAAVLHELVAFKKDPREYMADWEASGVLGTLIYWPDVASAFLQESRHVEVWLPPGYDDDPSRRYPVIYMSDGQNLFDPRIANTGTDWGVDEAMMAGVEAGRFEPAIVVGAWSSSDRGQEYSPWHDAPAYARFLIEELIPRVNAEFRTRTGPESTFAMGSSMGGLLSYHLVKEHPDVFGACGCVSTHFVFSERMVSTFRGEEGGDLTPYILRDIEAGATLPAGRRFFFDYGTEGLDARYRPLHTAVERWLRDQGLQEGRDFLVREYPGADHNETSWRARVGDQLLWLLAAEAPPPPQ